MKFNPDHFRDFIREKFTEFRGQSLASLNDFARSMNVSSQVMSNWWSGKLKRRPAPDMVDLLIEKFGDEAYDALGMPVPGLSPKNSIVYLQASKEITREVRERNLDPEDPAFASLVSEVFEKYGVKVQRTD